MKTFKDGEFKFILRSYDKKRGKVLYTVYHKELLYDRIRAIANNIDKYYVDDNSFIDLERNGVLLKTIYAYDGEFCFDELESFCKDGSNCGL